jgi:hypothetical protein
LIGLLLLLLLLFHINEGWEIKVRARENSRDKTVLAGADTVTIITVFYTKEQIVINSYHRNDRN